MNSSELKSRAEKVEEAYRQASRNDFMLFAQGLRIASSSGPQLFENCMQDFQRECFEDLAPSLLAVRDGKMPLIRRFWIERTKKAAKDSDLAICIIWLVAFAVRPLLVQIGAADRMQAAIVRTRILDFVFYNPWLNDLIQVQAYRIVGKSGLGVAEIIAAEIPGSHGATPDVLIINELSHVTKWEFILNILDNADGVPQGLVLIATNAGIKGTKVEVLRNDATELDHWKVHLWQRPSPWLGKTDIADAKRRNVKGRFNRLYWGRWSSGKGDAIEEEDIDKCFEGGIGPLTKTIEGWQFVGGLDLGVTHDHSALAVLGVNVVTQRIILAQTRVWKPNPKTGQVDLTDVENACFAMHQTFGLFWFGFDPTEARLMAQRLIRRGVPMQEMSFSVPKNLDLMAQCFMQVLSAGRFLCYDDEEGTLRRDFGKFSIEEKLYGYKLVAVSDEYGHADLGTAVVIALPKAVAMLAGRQGLLPGDVLAVLDDDTEFTEKEVEALPDEMREIYEAHDNMDEGNRLYRQGESWDEFVI